MANISGMTNYELNQEAYRHLDPMPEDEKNIALTNIGAWFSFLSNIDYVGILCRERNDYTLIHLNNYNYTAAVKELTEVLESRGEIVDIQYAHGQDHFECWVKERRTESINEIEKETTFKWTPQVWMFVIFNASDWVIEVG